MIAPPGGHVLQCILEVVETNKRDTARVELLETAHGVTPPLIAIMVVNDISDAFRRRFPSVDPIVPLQSVQAEGVSGLARTVAFKVDGGVAYAIGIAAEVNRRAFVDWVDEERPVREWTIWHEMTHVQDMVWQVHSSGIDSFVAMFRSEDSANATRHNSHMFWWEYHAFRHVTAKMTKWLVGELPWFHVYARNMGFHEHLREYLIALPGVARRDPQYALEIRANLPYFWAAVMGLEDAGVSMLDAYRAAPGYKHLAPEADKIRALLRQMFEGAGKYRGDLLAELGVRLRETRRRLLHVIERN
jgi:hypothetical protein